jgi:L-ascorbate metabolism protein UlaG (beta-lactamase superfamily)
MLRRQERCVDVSAITWLGHSTVLIEVSGVRLLTDPLLRQRVGFLRRIGDAGTLAPGDVDAVLISHVHYDHLDLPSLEPWRSCPLVVPRGAGRFLRKRGFGVIELERGEETRIGEVAVQATFADHRARRGARATAIPSLGYLVSGSQRIYFAGDTDLFEGMARLTPRLDVALLPVAGWGHRVPAGHLDPERAAQALRLLRPRVAIPIHWGTYRRIGLSREQAILREPADAFKRRAAELAPEVDVRLLPVGGRLELDAPGDEAARDRRAAREETA